MSATAALPRALRPAAALVPGGLLALLVFILLLFSGGGGREAGLGAWPFLALCAWAAAVMASESAFGPHMLHEPLVAGAVAGAILGRPFQGAAIGLFFQLLWPGLAPMGGSLEPKAGLGALAAVAWAACLPASWGGAALAAALGAGVGLACLGREIEGLRRHRNEKREQALLPADEADCEVAPLVLRRDAAARLARLGLLDSLAAGMLVLALAAGVPALLLPLAGIVPSPAAAALGPSWTGGAPGGFTPARLACFGPGFILGLLFVGASAVGGGLRAGERGGASGPGRHPSPPVRPAAPLRLEEARPPRQGLRCLLELMLIQAGFSDRFMQRSGFTLLLGGAVPGRIVGREGEGARRRFICGMLGDRPPNTQPLMAAALVGALDRVLEAGADDPGRSPRRLLQWGGSLLAQWGDRMVWGFLRPALALLAVWLLPLSVSGALLGWFLFATAAELLARRGLYRWGWRAGWDLVPLRAGVLWRRLESGRALALPLLAAGALLWIGAGWWHLGAHALWTAPAGSTMLGLFCGALTARRPIARGWIGAAALAAAALGERAMF